MAKPSKTIFITGAGAGIGAATARLFVSKGWRVGLYDRDLDAVTELSQELGDTTVAGPLDVTDADQWEMALSDFMAWAGRLDVLFNNAGILYSGEFESIPLAEQIRTMRVNVEGVLIGCHSAFKYLRQNKGTRVINMSSASAIYGQINLASYSSSKFAVRGLTEALDGEWRKYGIRVMDIMPLFVQTGMVKDMNAGSIRRMGVKLTAEAIAATAWRVATAPLLMTKIHNPVGLSTHVLYKVSGLTPDRLNRFVNHVVGH